MVLRLVVVLLCTLGLSQKISDAFLWVYFSGNTPDQEQIRFAISTNGFDFTALNKDRAVINSSEIAEKKAIRDPHILRGEDGNFYMVATDMTASEGWESNRGIVMLKSKDLITWTSARVNMRTAFPNEFGDLDHAWAPETIYDPAEKKYMVYLSTRKGTGARNIISYAYANADFTALEAAPKQLYVPPDTDSCIDGDIVLFEGKYYLFFKTESHGSKVRHAVATNLKGPYTLIDTSGYVQITSDSAEGPCCYPLGDGRWVLIYDVQGGGQRYEFTITTDMLKFTLAKGSYDFVSRHGTVMPITQAEMDRLVTKWG